MDVVIPAWVMEDEQLRAVEKLIIAVLLTDSDMTLHDLSGRVGMYQHNVYRNVDALTRLGYLRKEPVRGGGGTGRRLVRRTVVLPEERKSA